MSFGPFLSWMRRKKDSNNKEDILQKFALKHKRMGIMLVKKIGLLFLLIAGSLLSTSLAGRQLNSANEFSKAVEYATHEEEILGKPINPKEIATLHERLLRANTKDYGSYDPAPALVKPPFKLIPN